MKKNASKNLRENGGEKLNSSRKHRENKLKMEKEK